LKRFVALRKSLRLTRIPPGASMDIEKVKREIEKEVLLNPRIPKIIRLLHTLEAIPDEEKFYFTGKKEEILRKLVERKYKNDSELKRDLKEVKFDLSWMPLKGADLSGLDFGKVKFIGSDLSNANLSYTNLSGSVLSLVKGINTCFSYSHANLSNFIMSECSGADFSFAELSMSNFQGCRLVSVCFRDANLSHADLSFSNLTDADFSNANTEGIILTGAKLNGTEFVNKPLEKAVEEPKYEKANSQEKEELSSNVYGISHYKSKPVYKRKHY